MAQTATTDEETLLATLSAPGSQPERLAVIAKMRRVDATPANRARVLEIGCGTGQNLIPWADRYRESTFLGLDVSEERVVQAAETAAELGLRNVEFRRQGIPDVGGNLDKFDYILVRDNYASLDPEAQSRLLAVCRDSLAPLGIGLIGYDTYPGCQVRDVLRSMMLYQARDNQSPEQQLFSSRILLGFLKNSLAEQHDLYSAAMKVEVETFAEQPDSVLRRRYPRDLNRPLYLREFIAHAKNHTLKLLGDCSLGIRFADAISPQIEQNLSNLTSDPLQQEQIRDVLRNRACRQALLCHEQVDLQPTASAELLHGTYLAAQIRAEDPELDLRAVRVERFVAANGMTMSTGAPLIKAALLELGSAWPNYVRFEDLVAAACARFEGIAIPAEELGRLEDNLLQCCYGETIEVHSEPHPFTAELSARPVGSLVARWQAGRESVVTNRRHERVQIADLDRLVLQLSDGSHDLEQLTDEMIELSRQGRFGILDGAQLLHDRERLRQAFNEAIPQSLARLARRALLVG